MSHAVQCEPLCEVQGADTLLMTSRRWDAGGAKLCSVPEGATVYAVARQAVKIHYPDHDEDFYSDATRWCRVRVDGRELNRGEWQYKLVAGARVEVLIAPHGGGGKKNPLAAILQLVVVVAAIAFQQYYLLPALEGVMSATAATVLSTAAVAMITSIGGMAINALFPIAQPALPSSNVDNSPTYSINGGQNAANPDGYVPLVLGEYRLTPPLAAKSWTSFEGDDQFLHMLVCWGHCDIEVSDFRIGETPIGEYADVNHVFHRATTGNDLELFAKGYNEQSVGVTIKNTDFWVTRAVGEADEIAYDIGFNALGKANKETGNIDPYSVDIIAEYSSDGATWHPACTPDEPGTVIDVATQSVTLMTYNWQAVIYVTPEGVVGSPSAINESNPFNPGFFGEIPEGSFIIHPERDRDTFFVPDSVSVNIERVPYTRPNGETGYHGRATVQAFTIDTRGKHRITASQAKPLTRSFRFAVPERNDYSLRIRRFSPDTDDQYIYDDSVWTTVRAIVNRPAFDSPLPLCVSELRIRASEQLSGYVNNFNAIVKSSVPDWDGTAWTTRTTDNPASLLRYVLTSGHGSYTTYGELKIDEESFVAFHTFCANRGYTFNFVCDTETLSWKRMVQIASAGRGAVTFDNDGKVSVIIDTANKTPVQMFTPRNSWGFRWDRTYSKYPHALRASFRDKGSDYRESNAFVYADGYDVNTAENIVEWKAEGKTDWNEVWRFGRYYLASMRLRPETVTLSTDWEWRMCRRGDLVIVQHDVLSNTFGAARIVGLIFYIDGQRTTVYNQDDVPAGLAPVGAVLDDTIIFSEPSPARYGIAVRTNTGRVLTYEITPMYGAESAEITFRNTLSPAQTPSIGALAAVALFGEQGTELGKYLVAGITPGENSSADLTLIPYAPEIDTADAGEIPPWSPAVPLTGIVKPDTLPTPIISEIRTDESVLIRSGDSLISCIAAWYALPFAPDPVMGDIQAQMRIRDDFGTEQYQSAPLAARYVQVQGVEDGRKYTVSLRLVSARGVTSPWCEPQTVTVIGKTSPPPAVTGLTLTADNPNGLRLAWDAVNVGDLAGYVVEWGTPEDMTNGTQQTIRTTDTSALVAPIGVTGTVSATVRAFDTLNLEGESATAETVVTPPSAPVVRFETVNGVGTSLAWTVNRGTWNTERYTVRDIHNGTTAETVDTAHTVTPRTAGQTYRFGVTAVDVFGNASDEGFCDVTVPAIATPLPSVTVDGSQLVVKWQTVDAPFGVDVYEVRDLTKNRLMGKVKGTEFRFEAPTAGTKQYAVRAVDAVGNQGAWGDCSIVLSVPASPSVAAKLSDDKTMIELTWSQPAAQLPVRSYDVIRQWTETLPDGTSQTREEDYGQHDELALFVPAVSAGNHSFLIRGIDSAGNVGTFGSVDFVAQSPGRVTFFECSATDNNVMIYYTDPDRIFFAIKEYVVEEVEAGGYAAEIGRTDTHFFADIKNKGGLYGYGVTPVDVAGNRGQRAVVNISVSDPPDFLVFTEQESLFNGERVNMALDGNGSMIGPVRQGETWAQNAELVASRVGTSASALTWQGKVNAGYTAWPSPSADSATYTETIDAGAVIPSTQISVDVTTAIIDGAPVLTCSIETSVDGVAWTEAVDNGLTAFATNFRYARFTFGITGGLLAVSRIFYSLNIKRKTDFGRAVCNASDEGGTEIFFNVPFTEIQSLPRPNVVNDTDGLTAFTTFAGGLNPVSFRCMVKNKNGERVTATVDWLAGGV